MTQVSTKSGLLVTDEPVYQSEISTDGTMAANSDSLIPTQKAIVTYVATHGGGGGGISGSGSNGQLALFTGSTAIGSSNQFNYTIGSNTVTVSVGGLPNQNPTIGDPAHLFEVITSDTSSQFSMMFSMYGSLGGQNDVHWRRFRGTVPFPKNVQIGDYFMSNGFRGAYGTGSNNTFGGVSQSSAAFQVIATEDWVDSTHLGAAFVWQTTPNGSNIRNQSMYLTGSGQLLIGQQTTASLGTTNQLDIQSNANNNSGCIYIKNGSSGNLASSGLIAINDQGATMIAIMPSSGYVYSDFADGQKGLLYTSGTNGMGILSTSGTGGIYFYTAGDQNTRKFSVLPAGGVAVGRATLATTATDGFLYIPTCAGTPTGTPTAQVGTVPMLFDTTNSKLYIYNGSWKGGTVPGAFV